MVSTTTGVSLRAALPEARSYPSRDFCVKSACADHRRIKAGDLFVAVTGADYDGHEHAREAVAAGATAIVSEHVLPADVPVFVVHDSREAFGRLCQALAGNPSRRLSTIGVTGSHGKTVTSLLLAAMFEAAGQTAGVTSSVGCSDGVNQTVRRRGGLDQLEFAHWLGRMDENGCDAGILEIGSRELAERRVSGIELDVAILTNLRREHVGRHGSLQNYIRAKRRLFELLKPGGLAIVNADDATSRQLVDSLPCGALSFGLHLEADVTATIVERHASEQTFLLRIGDEVIPVCTRMIGDQHVSNCLAAATTAIALGLPLAAIVKGIEAVAHVPGRLERVECGQEFSVYLDGARTPDRLAIALQAVKQAKQGGRVICVSGAPGEHNKAMRPLLGRVIERSADVAILTSDDPRHEQPLRIAHDLLDGFTKPGKAHVLPNRESAIRFALSQARPGDAVLIAGKGDRSRQIIGNRKQAWNERELVERLIRNPIESRPQLRVVG